LWARRVAEMIGLADVAGAGEEGFVAARALFETLARARPLVLVFDDIHWAEETFLDFVEHAAAWTRDAPVRLVCLARPELLDVRPGWGGGKLNATATLLEPLSAEETEVLLQELGGAGDLQARILRAAEGNPLFVEEMVALVRDADNGDIEVPP